MDVAGGKSETFRTDATISKFDRNRMVYDERGRVTLGTPGIKGNTAIFKETNCRRFGRKLKKKVIYDRYGISNHLRSVSISSVYAGLRLL